MKITKKTGFLLLCCALVIFASIFLMRSDSSVFIKWWLMSLIIGIGFFPLTAFLFSGFKDKGWIFSKILGVAAAGFVSYIIIAVGIGKFTTVFIYAVTLILIAFCWIFFYLKNKKTGLLNSSGDEFYIDMDLVLLEEFLFLLLFLMWSYFAGFNPAAYGTEKFMDYGFMAAMMRDGSLPAKDIWYSGGTINYYYGGQYFAVFLTKLTGTRINETYNIMRTFVAAAAFVQPFSIVYQVMADRNKGGGKKWLNITAGIFSGAAVTLAGNMHYVLYGLFGNVFKLSGYEDYWFPSSTRYIGHNPETLDQCIHEYPSYSFVLGDLHAHVVNIIFVLLFIGIIYSWFRKKEEQYLKVTAIGTAAENSQRTIKEAALKAAKDPYIWILGVLLGMFQLNNYWDFVIYMTVVVIGVVLLAIRHKTAGRAVTALVRIVILAVSSAAAAAPFNAKFITMIGGINFVNERSALYQLIILWGLPAAAVLMLFIYTIIRHAKNVKISKENNIQKKNYVAGRDFADMFMLLMGICAIGLVLVPEIIYAVDIYDDGMSRCNTMFKMTYQAYIMFGMSMIYSIFRIGADVKKKCVKAIAGILIVLFLLTCGYFPYAVNCWFGDVLNPDGYQGLDATAFLETTYPSDAEAIRWLNENIEGNPVVLEANGDSYSDAQVVSAMTGLPTVLGWYGHEWLWRNDPYDLAMISEDIRTIYTSTDVELVKEKIKQYQVEYIYVGSNEREGYPLLNEELLLSLGEVVFRGTETDAPAYIIKVAAD